MLRFIGEESVGFSYKAFQFLTHEEQQLLNVNCVVNVCLEEDCPTDALCMI